MQIRVVTCAEKNGNDEFQVTDSKYCNATVKPETSRRCEDSKPCQVNYFVSKWRKVIFYFLHSVRYPTGPASANNIFYLGTLDLQMVDFNGFYIHQKIFPFLLSFIDAIPFSNYSDFAYKLCDQMPSQKFIFV